MSEPQSVILTLNSGSSSLKFSLFSTRPEAELALLYQGKVTDIGNASSRFYIQDHHGTKQQQISLSHHQQALQFILEWIQHKIQNVHLIGIGHRIVHGGTRFHAPTLISDQVLAYLETLIPLAPNHQPANLQAMTLLKALYPDLPQIACFDTAFHATRPEVEQRFALPQYPMLDNVRRYGFHGLSYEYITHVLPDYLGNIAKGKIVIAHLGNGASLCAVERLHSIATTMTFTPLDGIPMSTRSGSVDPAVVLYLQQQGMSHQAISDLLYFQSGLAGLSGISGDMKTLLQHTAPEAKFAIDLFVHHTVRAIGSLAAALGGIDALVFTGGIGEQSADIRAAIIERCQWLGLKLNTLSNQQHGPCITEQESCPSAWVIPTNEELMIARHSNAILTNSYEDK